MNAVNFYKCLADDTRLRCLLLIYLEKELCVCELTEALDVVQPKISRHLAQLRECQLLLDRRQGKWVFYRLNDSLPAWQLNVIAVTAHDQDQFISENLERLSLMGDRPDRIQNCC